VIESVLISANRFNGFPSVGREVNR